MSKKAGRRIRSRNRKRKQKNIESSGSTVSESTSAVKPEIGFSEKFRIYSKDLFETGKRFD